MDSCCAIPVLCMVSAGLYITYEKLYGYKAGDIKFCYLNQESNHALLQLLFSLDSL
jgi:hypothetical protein